MMVYNAYGTCSLLNSGMSCCLSKEANHACHIQHQSCDSLGGAGCSLLGVFVCGVTSGVSVCTGCVAGLPWCIWHPVAVVQWWWCTCLMLCQVGMQVSELPVRQVTESCGGRAECVNRYGVGSGSSLGEQ